MDNYQKTLLDDLLPDQRLKSVNTQAQVHRLKPPEQFDFWSNVIDLNQAMFKQKIYKFNSIIHSNLFVGFCKVRNVSPTSLIVILILLLLIFFKTNELFFVILENVIYCIMGVKTDQELAMVPDHETEQKNIVG
ncbi:hypothetical protein P9112_004620 [Eukaryota sp. TZLM1-RC]